MTPGRRGRGRGRKDDDRTPRQRKRQPQEGGSDNSGDEESGDEEQVVKRTSDRRRKKLVEPCDGDDTAESPAKCEEGGSNSAEGQRSANCEAGDGQCEGSDSGVGEEGEGEGNDSPKKTAGRRGRSNKPGSETPGRRTRQTKEQPVDDCDGEGMKEESDNDGPCEKEAGSESSERVTSSGAIKQEDEAMEVEDGADNDVKENK